MSHERAQWTIYGWTNRPTLTYCRGAVHVCTNWPFSFSFFRSCLPKKQLGVYQNHCALFKKVINVNSAI